MELKAKAAGLPALFRGAAEKWEAEHPKAKAKGRAAPAKAGVKR